MADATASPSHQVPYAQPEVSANIDQMNKVCANALQNGAFRPFLAVIAKLYAK